VTDAAKTDKGFICCEKTFEGAEGVGWRGGREMKGDHLMISWHNSQNKPEIGFDGNTVVIKMVLDKPVHNDWNCIAEKGPITCPKDIQQKCMTDKYVAPCIAGFVNLEEK